MPGWREDYRSALSMAALFIGTVLLGMLLSIPFMQMGYQAFEDPESMWIPVMYIVFILIFSGAVLFLAKKKRLGIIQGLVLFASGLTLMYVVTIPYSYLFDAVFTTSYIYTHFDMLSWALLFMSVGTAAALTYALYKYPEWYVVDGIGLVVGAGIIALLGVSLGYKPLFVLLIALAIYDAISVYKTKHMIDLADAVTEKRLPVVMVVPKRKGYSFRKQKGLKKTLAGKGKREAMFMGLGDIVFPGSLVISAMMFLGSEIIQNGEVVGMEPTWASFGVAMTTLIGSLVGYAVLMRYVMKGRPQAGLPLLNSGAILGFAVGYFILFWAPGIL